MRSDFSGQRLACPHCHANNFVGQTQCWQCKGSLPPPETTGVAVPATSVPTPPAWAQHPSAQYPMPNAQYPAPNAQRPTPNAQYPVPNVLTSTPPAPNAQSATSRTLLPLFLCVTLLTASGVLWYATHRMPASTSSGSVDSVSAAFPGESAGMRDLRRDARGVVPEREMPNSGLPDPGNAPLPGVGHDSLPTSGDPTEMAAKKAVEHALPKLGLPPGGGSSDGRVHLRNGDSISQEQYDEVQRKLKSNPLFGSGAPVPRL